jgi:hypothetical protein
MSQEEIQNLGHFEACLLGCLFLAGSSLRWIFASLDLRFAGSSLRWIFASLDLRFFLGGALLCLIFALLWGFVWGYGTFFFAARSVCSLSYWVFACGWGADGAL